MNLSIVNEEKNLDSFINMDGFSIAKNDEEYAFQKRSGIINPINIDDIENSTITSLGGEIDFFGNKIGPNFEIKTLTAGENIIIRDDLPLEVLGIAKNIRETVLTSIDHIGRAPTDLLSLGYSIVDPPNIVKKEINGFEEYVYDFPSLNPNIISKSFSELRPDVSYFFEILKYKTPSNSVLSATMNTNNGVELMIFNTSNFITISLNGEQKELPSLINNNYINYGVVVEGSSAKLIINGRDILTVPTMDILIGVGRFIITTSSQFEFTSMGYSIFNDPKTIPLLIDQHILEIVILPYSIRDWIIDISSILFNSKRHILLINNSAFFGSIKYLSSAKNALFNATDESITKNINFNGDDVLYCNTIDNGKLFYSKPAKINNLLANVGYIGVNIDYMDSNFTSNVEKKIVLTQPNIGDFIINSTFPPFNIGYELSGVINFQGTNPGGLLVNKVNRQITIWTFVIEYSNKNATIESTFTMRLSAETNTSSATQNEFFSEFSLPTGVNEGTIKFNFITINSNLEEIVYFPYISYSQNDANLIIELKKIFIYSKEQNNYKISI